MAPIKFEENIKEKLERREIKPSSSAWNELSRKLNEDEQESSKRPFWWLGIAASFIGLFIISIVMINNTSTSTDMTPVLVEDEKKHMNNGFHEEQPILDLEETVTDATEEETPFEDQLEPDSRISIYVAEAVNKEAQFDAEEIVPDPLVIIDEVEEETIVQVENMEVISINEVEEGVTLTQQTSSSVASVADAEIEALLNQAQKEINQPDRSIIPETTIKAESLLLDVESELNESFRNRVFEALKTGYKKVKTAVAERNN